LRHGLAVALALGGAALVFAAENLASWQSSSWTEDTPIPAGTYRGPGPRQIPDRRGHEPQDHAGSEYQPGDPATDRASQLSANDRTMAELNFVSRLKSVCLTDLADARRQPSYDYFQRKLVDEQRYRDSMAAAVERCFQKNTAH
jgi:hypothetical protein